MVLENHGTHTLIFFNTKFYQRQFYRTFYRVNIILIGDCKVGRNQARRKLCLQQVSTYKRFLFGEVENEITSRQLTKKLSILRM